MTRPVGKKDDAHITSPWDSTAHRALCVEPEGEPTAVIPAALLMRLLAETADRSGKDRVPRFEVVELDPEDLIIDDSEFERAFAGILGANGSQEAT